MYSVLLLMDTLKTIFTFSSFAHLQGDVIIRMFVFVGLFCKRDL